MVTTLKRQGAFLLLLALIVPVLAACGSGAGTTNAPTSAAPAAQPTAAPAAEPTTAPAAEPTTAPATEPTAAPAAQPTAATTETGMLPEVDPATVTGDFAAAGSSTVYPLTERIVERFKEDGYQGNPAIENIGTGAGFERFCNGEADIANASRAIKEEEVAKCKEKNIEPVEFRVGTDALSVVVNNENTFLEDITIADLKKVYSGEVTTWDQLNPSYPKEQIQVFSPGSDSGTFDYFLEVVFKDEYKADKKAAAAALLKTPGIQLSENDNVLVQGVEGSPYAIGYFGYAYYNAAKDRLQAVKIGGVEPNEQTAESGEYPIARPLFIYSSAQIMSDKPQVAAFINYYLTIVNDEILDVGYFPTSEENLNTSKENWLGANG